MATNERQTFKQMKAQLGCAFAMGIAMAFSSAYADELTCELSHLSAPAQNIELIALSLAKFRLQIYQTLNSSGEKARADREFQVKYSEFEGRAGSKEKARELFQTQISRLMKRHQADQPKSNEIKEKEHKERERESINPINLARKIEFLEIRPGEFLMGDSNKVPVKIEKPFAMMSTQVTQMMWARLQVAMGETDLNKINPSKFKTGPSNTSVNFDGLEVVMLPDHPVEQVSWLEATAMLKKLNLMSENKDENIQKVLRELIPDHKQGDIYDLPTSAQWEFVMKNRGKATALWFDREDSLEVLNYAWRQPNSQQRTHEVASLHPRMVDDQAFYDLEGNVDEWTKDLESQDEYGAWYITRGGNYTTAQSTERSSGYHAQLGHTPRSFVGLRLVRTRP